ncbi:hypothetical protein IEQ34_019628 [Dendrobium chrysotoxum]|uniref:DNA-(apurinic or apyrimidinic site) lyase n=1 Tax=Dendrobium chrysotoxum TaxID=161865 RepID=A0AAV7G9E6_DENCH|nr:hypothetical protein IEQ34_019628 [Dendrobium chrysotoxum]
MRSRIFPCPAQHLPKQLRPFCGVMSQLRRLKTPPPTTPLIFSATSLPSPHPTTPPKEESNSSAPFRSRTQRSLNTSLLHSAAVAGRDWQLLDVPRSELSLRLTLPTGQTFRWRRTGPSQFTGVVGPHLLSLKHADEDPSGRVHFFLHDSSDASCARAALSDYLNLEISLTAMWRGFSAADPRFDEISRRFDGGARVLRQDPVECVFQFLCSSNNNIARIEKMVGVLSSFGEYLGSVGGFHFHQFPTLERLSVVSEQQLREAGFGYRAKYIVGAIKALQAKPGGGVEWLASLRSMDLQDVLEALCSLPGVGPKVAACIALFSLDQHQAIPVDTHVWQIATRYFMPELSGAQMTPKLSTRVAEIFIATFGKYAGWAQNVLFIGELPSQKALLPAEMLASKNTKSAKRKRSNRKIEVQ